MKRIFKYLKSKKGITLVLMAFMLALLLMLAGLAIDIAYMYYVKNQLQVAADASALAGAANLTGEIDNIILNPNVLKQMDARQEAWKFACKNRAANQSVFLVTNSSTNCDAPPASDLNETSNTSTGDIVVGNWNSSTRIFTPATGSTGLPINALRARPRRTNETPGMPRVSLFLGQIFSLIGADWSTMSAAASAIASFPPVTYAPLPICVDTCLNLPQTPLTGTPPGLLIKINPATPGAFEPDRTAWTDFQDFQSIPGTPSDYRHNPGDPPGIRDLLGVEKQGNTWIVKQPEPPPDECNTVTCLRTQQGISVELGAISAIIAARGKTYTIKGYSIFGWRTFLPVFDPCSPSGPPSGFVCPGDQPSGYRFVQVTEVIITGVEVPAGPGDPGIYIVGLDVDPSTTDADKTKTRCIPCNDPTIQSTQGVHLVK